MSAEGPPAFPSPEMPNTDDDEEILKKKPRSSPISLPSFGVEKPKEDDSASPVPPLEVAERPLQDGLAERPEAVPHFDQERINAEFSEITSQLEQPEAEQLTYPTEPSTIEAQYPAAPAPVPQPGSFEHIIQQEFPEAPQPVIGQAAPIEPEVRAAPPLNTEAEFQSIVQQNFDPSFNQAYHAPTPVEVAPAQEQVDQAAASVSAYSGASYGGGQPTRPQYGSGPTPQPYNSPNYYNQPPQQAGQQVNMPPMPSLNVNLAPNALGGIAELAGNTLRRAAVTSVVAFGLLAYLSNRRRINQVESQLRQEVQTREDQVEDLQETNHDLQRKLTMQTQEADRRDQDLVRLQQQFENQPLPVAQTVELPAAEQVEPIRIENDQHLEIPAAGYSAVVNRRGEVIENAYNVGQEQENDRRIGQKVSQMPRIDSGWSGGADAYAPTASQSVGVPTDLRPVAQTQATTSLPGVQPTGAPINNLGSSKQPAKVYNPLVSAVLNPWFWTCLAAILIIFFVATLA